MRVIAIAFFFFLVVPMFSQVLDETFATGGVSAFVLGDNFCYATDLAKQSDDKIVACGKYEQTEIARAVIVRYFPDGNLDTSFGNNGMVLPEIVTSDELFDFPRVKIQEDGKILVTVNEYVKADLKIIKLLRLNTDGSFDTGFGENGTVTIDLNGLWHSVNAIEIQADQKILLAGKNDGSLQLDNFEIIRLNTDGTFDTSFGINGVVDLNIGFNNASHSIDDIGAMKVLPDGKIILGGSSDVNSTPQMYNFVLVKLNPGGSLDSTFGNNGMVITDFGFNDGINTMALTNDNHIVACGSIGINGNQIFKIGLAKYDLDGNPDVAFGTDGKVITQASAPMDFDFITGMAITQDNKILLAGSSHNSSYDILLLRYQPDGALDPGFDNDGIFLSDFTSTFEAGFALLLLPDENFIVGGASMLSGESAFTLSKYNYDTLSMTGFQQERFSLYPNPVTDQIALSNNVSVEAVTITDITGKIMMDQTGRNIFPINLQHLRPGFYNIEIRTEQKAAHLKFIKK